jgi:hypothetical protein
MDFSTGFERVEDTTTAGGRQWETWMTALAVTTVGYNLYTEKLSNEQRGYRADDFRSQGSGASA